MVAEIDLASSILGAFSPPASLADGDPADSFLLVCSSDPKECPVVMLNHLKTGFSFLLEGLAGFPLFSVPVRHLLKAYLVLMIMLNFFLICKTFFKLKRIF